MAGEMAERIGRNIRAARLEKGWNQRELAQEIPDPAASNVAVSEWERGIRKPSDRYMPQIAETLGKPVEWFFRDHSEGDQTPTLEEILEDVEDGARLDRIEARLDGLQVLIETMAGAEIVAAAQLELERRRRRDA